MRKFDESTVDPKALKEKGKKVLVVCNTVEQAQAVYILKYQGQKEPRNHRAHPSPLFDEFWLPVV